MLIENSKMLSCIQQLWLTVLIGTGHAVIRVDKAQKTIPETVAVDRDPAQIPEAAATIAEPIPEALIPSVKVSIPNFAAVLRELECQVCWKNIL